MKKLLLETSFSKIYMIVMIIITLLIVGGYFSYAMFTVSKEKGNAISIVTGNLEYKLTVDSEETNKLTVESNSVKDFIVTLSNPNNIKARFNFYYIGEEPSYTKIGYIVDEGMNIPPLEVGTTLEKVNSIGSSNTYIVRVINNSANTVEFTLGVSVGLDYNDLSLKDNGHLLEEITDKGEVGTVVLDDISKDSLYDDGTDTFITGEYPNNYIWYSGKLWRAVSVNNEAKTVKLVTQWNISAIPYNKESNTSFNGSYIEKWLNDTTVDGFLGNLREPEKFIVTDAKWDATMDDRALDELTRPNGTTIVTNPIGLLNMYEYQVVNSKNSYLNNGVSWWTLTPYSSYLFRHVDSDGSATNYGPISVSGVRPSINLKSNVKIVDGNGTESDPYRLEGDNDTISLGTKLSSRYSGEYVQFGNDENNLYRIVSHENGVGTKIVSDKPLKDLDTGTFKTMAFGDNINYSSTNTIGTFLNEEYLTNYVDDTYNNMIEDNTTWYLGTVGRGESYRLAKYTDTTGNILTSNTSNAKVGLLRLGELMAGSFDMYKNNVDYWTLTPYTSSNVHRINIYSSSSYDSSILIGGVKPALNLKSNVQITSGTGTKSDPFKLELAN